MKRLAVDRLRPCRRHFRARRGAGRSGPDNVNLVIVYGNDECRASPDAKRDRRLRRAWTKTNATASRPICAKATAPRTKPGPAGSRASKPSAISGSMSCSASGYGGWSGCTRAADQRTPMPKSATRPDVRAAQLIAGRARQAPCRRSTPMPPPSRRGSKCSRSEYDAPCKEAPKRDGHGRSALPGRLIATGQMHP